MSRITVRRFSGLVAAMALVLSIGLQSLQAKDTKGETSSVVTVQNATSLGGQEIKPGDYMVSVTETQVTMTRNGKVVAQAPVQWKDETAKPRYTTIVTDGNKIKEFHFGGKTRFVEVAPAS